MCPHPISNSLNYFDSLAFCGGSFFNSLLAYSIENLSGIMGLIHVEPVHWVTWWGTEPDRKMDPNQYNNMIFSTFILHLVVMVYKMILFSVQSFCLRSNSLISSDSRSKNVLPLMR